MKFTTARLRRRVLVVPLGALGILLAAVQSSGQSLDPKLHRDAAKRVFERAVTLLQTVGVPPNASVDRVPTSDDISRMRADGNAALKAVFTSNAIAEGAAHLANAVQMAGTDVRALGGGVSKIVYDSVAPYADGSYVITAHVTAWAKLAQVVNGHAAVATSSNVLIVTATLIPASGSYLVDSYNWEFAPGSEP